MKEVERTYRGNKRTYPIYTQEEADEKGLEYVYWKDARSAGEFAISDDNYVCEVINVTGPYTSKSSGKESRKIILPYCRMFDAPSATIAFEEYYGHGDYSRMTPGTWAERESRARRTKRVIRMYAAILFSKGRASEEDLHILGRVYRPDQEIPKASFKRLLKQKPIRKMVQEELKNLLLDEEITPAELIRRYDQTFHQATKKGQLGVAKSVLDKFSEYLRMDGGGPQNPAGELPEGGTEDGELIGLIGSSEEIIEDDDEHYLSEDDAIEVEPIKEQANASGD